MNRRMCGISRQQPGGFDCRAWVPQVVGVNSLVLPNSSYHQCGRDRADAIERRSRRRPLQCSLTIDCESSGKPEDYGKQDRIGGRMEAKIEKLMKRHHRQRREQRGKDWNLVADELPASTPEHKAQTSETKREREEPRNSSLGKQLQIVIVSLAKRPIRVPGRSLIVREKLGPSPKTHSHHTELAHHPHPLLPNRKADPEAGFMFQGLIQARVDLRAGGRADA